ncbi:MAG: hypothetical protein AAF890_07795 [Pseudomonadota bacterium]
MLKRWKIWVAGILAIVLLGGGFVAGLWASTQEIVAKTFIEPRLNAQSFAKRAREQAKDKMWAERLIKGGYIIHLRHAQREKWRDSAAFDAIELATKTDASKSTFAKATCLTPQGVEEAKMIGRVFEIAKLQVSKVYSSPSCRAWQTALHAFGPDYTIDNSLLNRSAMIPSERAGFARQLRNLILNAEIKPGTNIVLTGHGATLEWDGKIGLDENQMIRRKPRHETGFFVLERVDGKIIARYKFSSLRDFSSVTVSLAGGN